MPRNLDRYVENIVQDHLDEMTQKHSIKSNDVKYHVLRNLWWKTETRHDGLFATVTVWIPYSKSTWGMVQKAQQIHRPFEGSPYKIQDVTEALVDKIIEELHKFAGQKVIYEIFSETTKRELSA